MMLSGWGRFPHYDCRVASPRSEAELRCLVAEGRLIARGNGRAYGDAALNIGQTVDMRRFNHMLAFDPATGQLVVEAGVLLEDVIAAFLPRGWFPSVTPGTKFVTIGGMIAADVHGKNHHKHGAFGSFVDWVDVMVASGKVKRASRTENPDLFFWTIGGMGLTGIILRAAIRLQPVETGWIKQTLIPAPNLGAAMQTFAEHQHVTYSVAWIDCLSSGDALGRSLVMLGEHAERRDLPLKDSVKPFLTPKKRQLTVPMDAPSFALNRLSVRAFNEVYYRNGLRHAGDSLVDWDTYFYPLDAILRWNRIYGRRGLMQYQCVLPLAASEAGLRSLLSSIAAAGQGSFLAVLKRFGPQESRISFPMEGYTLALDFPVNRHALALLNDLDRITLAHGGRFYLAKDARMTPDTARRSDPRLAEFSAMRRASKAGEHFTSLQSERLKI